MVCRHIWQCEGDQGSTSLPVQSTLSLSHQHKWFHQALLTLIDIIERIGHRQDQTVTGCLRTFLHKTLGLPMVHALHEVSDLASGVSGGERVSRARMSSNSL